jgi:hypothetical protein
MFTQRKIDSALDAEITSALAELEKSRDDPEKYNATLDRIGRLQKTKPQSGLFKLPLDTMLICSTNIFGVLWLARYERENVIKAPNAFRSVIRLK